MVLKKTSSSLKVGIILISIIIISLLHFRFSISIENRQQYLSNSMKLLKTNELVLQKIDVLSELFNTKQINTKNEALAAADLFDYSLSILINGGNISESGNIISFEVPDSEKLFKLKEFESNWQAYFKTLKKLSKNHDNEGLLRSLKKNYISLVSIHETLTDLYITDYQNSKTIAFTIHLIAVIFYIIISVFLFLFIINTFIKPIKSVELVIDDIAKGRSVDTESDLTSEFSNVQSNLHNLYYKTNIVSDFVKQLVNDNYEVQFKDYDEKDHLELSLVQLRNKLKDNIELNNRRLDEEKLRHWFAEGQAKFNDILRESSSSINLLAESSLKSLVKFFNAAQGGFFILKEYSNELFLELSSAFAYDRVKAINKRIPIGEGLIGMCALEKNTIWLDNIPEDYMEVESGLGEAPPTNLLIIPLKTDENILGVIEIASFNKFTKNEVDFIENIADDIASTLETTKITDKTSVLLEESQKKSDELAERDSEMSEKIVELRVAQKETKRSETEMSGLINAVDKVLFKIELTPRGKINSVNHLFVKEMSMQSEEFRNNSLFEYIKDKDKSLIDSILKKVKNDESVQQTLTFISKTNIEIKVHTLFSPIKNEQGQIIKILILGDNIDIIDELTNKNTLLVTETEIQKEQLLDLNANFEKSIKEYQAKSENSEEELNKHIKKEKQIKENNESEKDKKYFQWLNSFKS